MNDATGLILYTISSTVYKGGSASVYNVLSMFMTLTGGGLLLGLLIGFIVALFTKKVFNDTVLCVNAFFVSGFIGFFIAESVCADYGYAVSGIMTLISTGLFLASFTKSNIKEDVEHSIHQFWYYYLPISILDMVIF